jgi:hypothetical protein
MFLPVDSSSLYSTVLCILHTGSDVEYPNKTEAFEDTSTEEGLLIFTLIANGFLPVSSGTKVRHNTQITHFTQSNTPLSNKTQYTKLHK